MPTAAGIYYAQFDEGNKDQPPVILIHGAGSDHSIWPAEIRRMAGQRVMAVDLPGHGRTGGAGLQSIRAYAGQMVDFLAELGLYQAVFVGHSMGGAIALELAVNHPAHVAGLGLIATGAYLGVDPLFLENLSNPITASTALNFLRQRAFGQQAAPAMVERCMKSINETRASVLYGDWRACAEFDLRESISKAETPAWIIAGSEDQLIPMSYAHFLASRLPASRLQIIPGAGHMVLLEAPAQIAQGLQQFLSALAAARFAAARVSLPSPAPAGIYQRRIT